MKKWIIGVLSVLLVINIINYFTVKSQIPNIVTNILNENFECEEFEVFGATLPFSYLYATKYNSTVFLNGSDKRMYEVKAELLDASSPLVRIFGVTSMRVTLLGTEVQKFPLCTQS